MVYSEHHQGPPKRWQDYRPAATTSLPARSDCIRNRTSRHEPSESSSVSCRSSSPCIGSTSLRVITFTHYDLAYVACIYRYSVDVWTTSWATSTGSTRLAVALLVLCLCPWIPRTYIHSVPLVLSFTSIIIVIPLCSHAFKGTHLTYLPAIRHLRPSLITVWPLRSSTHTTIRYVLCS